MRRLLATLTLTLGCLCLTPAFALSPPADECNTDSDCVNGACVTSEPTCVEWPEPGNIVCFTHKLCSEVETPCGSATDCAADQYCERSEPEVCPSCPYEDRDGDGVNDIDCPPCALPPGVCRDIPSPISCQTDAQCGPNQYCEHANTPGCACPFIDEDGDGINDVDCAPCLPPHANGVCADIPSPNECRSDADCGPGALCQRVQACPTCLFVDENGDGVNDVECPPCIEEAFCVEDPNQGMCTSDADCAPDQQCNVSGVGDCACPFIDEDGDGESDVECDCAPPAPQGYCGPRAPGECQSDADCGPGARCEGVSACPGCAFIDEDGDGENDVDCPPCVSEQFCVPVEPAGCLSNEECAPGQTCQLTEECPPCPFIDEDGDGQSDIACDCGPGIGQCVGEPGGECIADADCGRGFQCTVDLTTTCQCPEGADCDCAPGVGYCEPIPVNGECRTDADCGQGLACVPETQCLPTPCPAPPEGQEEGYSCPEVCEQTFYCEPQEPVAGTCDADADCEAGQTCQVETQCGECPFVDEDGDGQSDVACAAVCDPVAVCVDENFPWVEPTEPVEPTGPNTPLCSTGRTSAPMEAPLGLMALLGLLGVGVRRRRQR